MIKKISLFITFLFLSIEIFAQQNITLIWDPNPESNIGYNIYRSTYPDTNAFTRQNIDLISVTTFTQPLAIESKYVFYATAVDTSNGLESDPSNTVIFNPSKLLSPIFTSVDLTGSGNNRSLVLTWNNVTRHINNYDIEPTDVVKYKLYVSSISENFSQATLLVDNLTANTYTINNIAIGSKNFYLVAYLYNSIISDVTTYVFNYTKPGAPRNIRVNIP